MPSFNFISFYNLNIINNNFIHNELQNEQFFNNYNSLSFNKYVSSYKNFSTDNAQYVNQPKLENDKNYTFEFQKMIGKGSFGIVMEVKDVKSQKNYALKFSLSKDNSALKEIEVNEYLKQDRDKTIKLDYMNKNYYYPFNFKFCPNFENLFLEINSENIFYFFDFTYIIEFFKQNKNLKNLFEKINDLCNYFKNLKLADNNEKKQSFLKYYQDFEINRILNFDYNDIIYLEKKINHIVITNEIITKLNEMKNEKETDEKNLFIDHIFKKLNDPVFFLKVVYISKLDFKDISFENNKNYRDEFNSFKFNFFTNENLRLVILFEKLEPIKKFHQCFKLTNYENPNPDFKIISCIFLNLVLKLLKLHTLKYRHNDIKPANLLCSKLDWIDWKKTSIEKYENTYKCQKKPKNESENDNEINLKNIELIFADFGGSLSIKNKIFSKIDTFTPLYIGPNSLKGGKEINQFEHDYYSMAATIYELLFEIIIINIDFKNLNEDIIPNLNEIHDLNKQFLTKDNLKAFLTYYKKLSVFGKSINIENGNLKLMLSNIPQIINNFKKINIKDFALKLHILEKLFDLIFKNKIDFIKEIKKVILMIFFLCIISLNNNSSILNVNYSDISNNYTDDKKKVFESILFNKFNESNHYLNFNLKFFKTIFEDQINFNPSNASNNTYYDKLQNFYNKLIKQNFAKFENIKYEPNKFNEPNKFLNVISPIEYYNHNNNSDQKFISFY